MAIQPLPHNLFTKWIQQGIQKGYIQDCIQTINGEAYISVNYIKKQCMIHIEKNKGRMTISYISDILNIDVTTLKPYLISLSNEQHWSFIDDILLTTDYIDQVKQSFVDIIEKNGFISLVAQTQNTSLPHRFLQKLLDTTSYINISELSDLYFTMDYIEKEKQRIINELQLIKQPLSMLKLQRSLEMQDSIFFVFLDQIIKDHVINGVFRGRHNKTVFIPQIYRDEQLALIDSLLKAGNYIEYQTIEQHYEFSTPKDLLLKQYPDIILLESCAVNDTMISSLEDVILTNDTWLDVSNHLPFALTNSDIITLLELTIHRLKMKKSSSSSEKEEETKKKMNINDIILLGKFIMTQDYLQIIIKKAQPFLQQRATFELSKNQKHLHSNKGKRKKNNVDIHLTEDDIVQHLVDNQGLDIELATILSAKLKRTFLNEIQTMIQSIYLPTLNDHHLNESNNNNNGNSNNDDNNNVNIWIENQKSNIQSILLDIGYRIYYNFKSIQVFEDESTKKSLEKYMVRQWTIDFVFYLTLFYSLYQCKDQNEVVSFTGLRSIDIENPNDVNEIQKKDLMAALISSDQELQKELLLLQQSIQTGKKMNEFIKYITSKTSLTEKISWGDLESENSLSQTNDQFRKMLQNQLKSTKVSEKTAPSILHLTVLIYFSIIHQSPLNVSGKYVPHIIKHLSSILSTTEPLAIPSINTMDSSYQLQLLLNAQDMILSGRKKNDTSISIDLELMSQVRDLGLNICKKE
ncbi:unnamed protein product [Cunninghamella blakesleeana]